MTLTNKILLEAEDDYQNRLYAYYDTMSDAKNEIVFDALSYKKGG